jgi:hypothetical protein
MHFSYMSYKSNVLVVRTVDVVVVASLFSRSKAALAPEKTLAVKQRATRKEGEYMIIADPKGRKAAIEVRGRKIVIESYNANGLHLISTDGSSPCSKVFTSPAGKTQVRLDSCTRIVHV